MIKLCSYDYSLQVRYLAVTFSLLLKKATHNNRKQHKATIDSNRKQHHNKSVIGSDPWVIQ